MRIIENFNRDWTFRAGFEPAFASASQPGETVQLPHTAVELPYNYFDEKSYQKAFNYQKVIAWDPRFEGREVSLVFDAAMADSMVYLNGAEIIGHKDGYTPFEARLTPHFKAGDNLLTVKIDGSENPEIPPFGGVIDYLTYAGIYRDVWLKITAPVSIANVKIETPDVLASTKQVTAKVWISNPADKALSGKVQHFFHLAAIYDLSADAASQQVANIDGTRHAIELAAAIKAGCFHHTSSIAAAGLYPGVFREDMFEEAEGLKDPYLRTKHESEGIVRKECKVPFRIYRPSMVIGHSKTGEMDKIDGPYYLFTLIKKIRQTLPQWMPTLGIEGGRINVVPVDFVHFFHGAERGKGNALWASLLASAGDIVVWIDGDITSFTTDWIVRLVVPLLIDDELGLVKANYERPSHLGGGGRTTELVARPLLSMYFPDIADLQQPLAGEFAGRRSMLEAIPFATGWGVEIGMLIDMAEKFGIQSLGQVDLGVRLHRHHKLETLAIQAAEVAATLLLRTPYPPDFAEDVPMLHRKELGPLQLNIGERPPVNSLPKMPQLPHSDRK